MVGLDPVTPRPPDASQVVPGPIAFVQLNACLPTTGSQIDVQAGPTLSRQSMWYATYVAGGPNTISVTYGGPTSFPDVRIVEYSGIAGTNALDGTTGISGNGTAIDSGPLTTMHGYDLLVAGTDVGDQSGGGSGFEERVITVPDGDVVEDRVVTVPGSYSATATQNTASSWSISFAAFRGVLDAPP